MKLSDENHRFEQQMENRNCSRNEKDWKFGKIFRGNKQKLTGSKERCLQREDTMLCFLRRTTLAAASPVAIFLSDFFRKCRSVSDSAALYRISMGHRWWSPLSATLITLPIIFIWAVKIGITKNI